MHEAKVPFRPIICMSPAMYKIGFSNLSDALPTSRMLREGIEYAASKHPELELIVRTNKMDAELVMEQCQGICVHKG